MTTITLAPKEFIIVRDNIPRTTSRLVAKAFGKRHDDLLKKMQRLDCSADFNARNFAGVEYVDSKGESRPMFEMTKDGFMFLVMGFTGKKAAAVKEAYIDAFNTMASLLAEKDSVASLSFSDEQKYKMVNTLIECLQFTEKPLLVPHIIFQQLARKVMGMDDSMEALRDLNKRAMKCVEDIEGATGMAFWEEQESLS